MLKRIYIDNYKCFSNFEFTPGPLNLLLIPKRNVETWVAHLNGATVDERNDYKPRHVEECRSAAARLHEHCSVAEPACCPPSLRDGCAELGRLA